MKILKYLDYNLPQGNLPYIARVFHDTDKNKSDKRLWRKPAGGWKKSGQGCTPGIAIHW